MKQLFYKILSTCLAIVVLFSSFSFTIDKHICMGEVTDVSYFTEVDFCEMHVDQCNIDKLTQSKQLKENCCIETQVLIPNNQSLQYTNDYFQLSQIQFALAFTFSYLNLFEVREKITPFKDYSPPIVDKDIQVLYQTFLI